MTIEIRHGQDSDGPNYGVRQEGWDTARKTVINQRFVAQLNRDLCEPQAVQCLLYEWSHALARNFSLNRLAKTPGINPAEFERACHDEVWGCAYSRVWRAYLEADRTDD